MQKIRVFLDSNAFDFFYNRRETINISTALPSSKYSLFLAPQIKDELFFSNTPQELQDYAQELINSEILKSDSGFLAFASYEDLPDKKYYGSGFTSYGAEEESDCGGEMLTYKHLEYNNILSFIDKPKQQNDALLAMRSVNNIVLTCDTKKSLGEAVAQGLKVVYLGKVSPETDSSCGFDGFNGSLEDYINEKLSQKNL